MKIWYKNWNPTSESLAIVYQAEEIIREYQKQGYTLTLRQIYYQFVARWWLENSDRSYKNLGNLINKARLAGLISWKAIEDRNREHNNFWYREDEAEAIEMLPRFIRFDQWGRQPCYIEVWVEKEALGNVVSRACRPLLVPHMACKGYLSASEAWRAGQRYEDKLNEGKHCVLIHLGDHDPSGMDMTRDNKDRLDLFTGGSGKVEIIRLALNMDQVERYSPPPNPAKITDSRAKEYIKKFGNTSWELDALEPAVMEEMIKDEINEYVDQYLWTQVEEQEVDVEERLGKLYDNWDKINHLLDNLEE